MLQTICFEIKLLSNRLYPFTRSQDLLSYDPTLRRMLHKQSKQLQPTQTNDHYSFSGSNKHAANKPVPTRSTSTVRI